ncbi:hypothetical protein P43SY_010581 [Pythium insidiosum]|uniref:FYVE-type domain-containing protein n=1 Tax=Pythium insidiosum TaxID=114742 RepID=A0AAD5LAC5_PYTIN|nr:hypothetical protein P43SY_010581 [Pythium insidiosum]
MHDDLLYDNDALVGRFLRSNYFASENLAGDASLTWEQVQSGVAPVGLSSYVNSAVTSATRRSTMACCDVVVSTLDEATKAIAADSTLAYGRLETELVGADLVVDAEVLETLRARTKENPDSYVGLKHVTYRPGVAIGSAFPGEDYVLLETTGRDIDPDGFAFVFRMQRSVHLRGLFKHTDPLSPEEDGALTRRGFLHSSMIILSETKHHGMLRMQVWLDVELPAPATNQSEPLFSSFSSLHDALSLSLRYRRVIERQFSASIKDGATSAAVYANLNLLPMIKMRSSQCQVCERKFGLFSRRRHACEVCQTALCGTCARTSDVCNWKLCACCYTRNHGLFSRQVFGKLASSKLTRLSYLARKAPGFQSVRDKSSRATRGPMSSTSSVDELPSIDKDPRRTSASGSVCSSATYSSSSISSLSSEPALRSSMSFRETLRSTLTERDLILDSYPAPLGARPSTMLNPGPHHRKGGVQLLDEDSMFRLSVAAWRMAADDISVGRRSSCLQEVQEDVRPSFSRDDLDFRLC